ncbi:MAG: DNA-3-methyladenine glycosylase [Congregibacter sp.]
MEAVTALLAADPDLAGVVQRCGLPDPIFREPGFATLLHIIFEQQVSLASAQATFDKVQASLDELNPRSYLRLSDQQLRAAGVSRQKARYSRLVAEAILDESFPIAGLAALSDEAARDALLALTGVGHWTADVYLMVALGREDCWPVGDLALQKAVADIKTLEWPLAKGQLERLGERYRPYRSVATRIFWHHYLSAGS